MKLVHSMLIAFFVFIVTSNAHAQNFGLIKNKGSTPGYNLFSPFRGTSVYLMDNAGHLINEWREPSQYASGANMFLTPQGTLVRTVQSGPNASPFGAGAGIGGLIREYDWDGNVIWEYPMKTLGATSHHTMILLPNGNFLVTAYSRQNCKGAFICPQIDVPEEGIEKDYFQSEKLIEIKPNRETGTTEVVWEWNLADHLLPLDADAAANPHLWGGIGTGGGPGDPRLTPNINHIDYNAELNQILLSCNSCDELWVIEKAPSTEAAAKNTGGFHGKGGGFIYRYGNRYNYGTAAITDKKIDMQHGARFIKPSDEFGWQLRGKRSDKHARKNRHKRAHNIIFYNNGFSTEDERAYTEIKPLRDRKGRYMLQDGVFEPSHPTRAFGNLGSPFMGSVQALPNGHTIINAGVGGTGIQGIAGFPPPGLETGFPIGGATAIELDKHGHEVWRFVNPLYSLNQGNVAGLNNRTTDGIIGADCPVVANWNAGFGPPAPTNWMFRMMRYSTDFEGFQGKDMWPKGLITDSGQCIEAPAEPAPAES